MLGGHLSFNINIRMIVCQYKLHCAVLIAVIQITFANILYSSRLIWLAGSTILLNNNLLGKLELTYF